MASFSPISGSLAPSPSSSFHSEYFFGENDTVFDNTDAAESSTDSGAEAQQAIDSLKNLDLTKAGNLSSQHVGAFLLGPVLGKGCTGVVRLGTHQETGFQVAFKIMKKKYLDSKPRLWQKVKREIAILKLIEHPNILRLYDVLETPDRIYLVLEHVKGGELFDFIIKKGRVERDLALRMVSQIVQGLEHCHEHSICHRDLKPENLLLDEKLNIKIADFGMAQLMKGSLLKTSCGSPHYASPEIINGGHYDGKRTDVWSIGVILYALVTGSLPFDDDKLPVLLGKVVKGEYYMPNWVPVDVADLIARMLTVDPQKRIPMSDIKRHPCYRGTDFFPKKPMGSPAIPSRTIRLDSRLDDSVIADLESLGWGTKDQLRSKITGGTGGELEATFYKLMLERKSSRLSELSRLSPKPQPRTLGSSSSSPGVSPLNSPTHLRHSITLPTRCRSAVQPCEQRSASGSCNCEENTGPMMSFDFAPPSPTSAMFSNTVRGPSSRTRPTPSPLLSVTTSQSQAMNPADVSHMTSDQFAYTTPPSSMSFVGSPCVSPSFRERASSSPPPLMTNPSAEGSPVTSPYLGTRVLASATSPTHASKGTVVGGSPQLPSSSSTSSTPPTSTRAGVFLPSHSPSQAYRQGPQPFPSAASSSASFLSTPSRAHPVSPTSRAVHSPEPHAFSEHCCVSSPTPESTSPALQSRAMLQRQQSAPTSSTTTTVTGKATSMNPNRTSQFQEPLPAAARTLFPGNGSYSGSGPSPTSSPVFSSSSYDTDSPSLSPATAVRTVGQPPSPFLLSPRSAAAKSSAFTSLSVSAPVPSIPARASSRVPGQTQGQHLAASEPATAVGSGQTVTHSGHAHARQISVPSPQPTKMAKTSERIVSTPRFHRRILQENDSEDEELEQVQSPKQSWFSAIFSRRPSIVDVMRTGKGSASPVPARSPQPPSPVAFSAGPSVVMPVNKPVQYVLQQLPGVLRKLDVAFRAHPGAQLDCEYIPRAPKRDTTEVPQDMVTTGDDDSAPDAQPPPQPQAQAQRASQAEHAQRQELHQQTQTQLLAAASASAGTGHKTQGENRASAQTQKEEDEDVDMAGESSSAPSSTSSSPSTYSGAATSPHASFVTSSPSSSSSSSASSSSSSSSAAASSSSVWSILRPRFFSEPAERRRLNDTNKGTKEKETQEGLAQQAVQFTLEVQPQTSKGADGCNIRIGYRSGNLQQFQRLQKEIVHVLNEGTASNTTPLVTTTSSPPFIASSSPTGAQRPMQQ